MLSASMRAYDLQLELYHAWEISRVTLEVGLGAGASLFQQRFETRGDASRLSAAPFIAPGVAARFDLSAGFYADLHIAAETHFLRLIDESQTPAELRAAFALRSALAAGKYF